MYSDEEIAEMQEIENERKYPKKPKVIEEEKSLLYYFGMIILTLIAVPIAMGIVGAILHMIARAFTFTN